MKPSDAAAVPAASDQRKRHGSPSDRRWWKRENWYRDVWLLLVTGLVLWTLTGIQANRHDAAKNSCVSQNSRNVETIRQLDRLVRGLPAKQRERALANVGGTVLLINALAPFHSDCDAYADAIVAGRRVPRGQPRPLPPGLRRAPTGR